MSDEGRARRRKRTASDDVVMAFLEAVYPGSGNLVAVCFDEEMVLHEATRQILAAAAARAEGEAAGLEQAAQTIEADALYYGTREGTRLAAAIRARGGAR
jgi:flagellar biosynthesis/type III secretory pathway protein FliH